jgi:cytochrome c oxidase assembly factor CtaG
MSPALEAFLSSWPYDPWLVATLVLTAAIYGRGWLILRRRDRRRWRGGELAAFVSGLGVIFLALASPIEPFADLLLQVHMVQHVLLMMAAPPLLWLGAPLFPLLRGLPGPIRANWAIPLFHSAAVRTLFARLTHPVTALPLFTLATWLWHLPGPYDLALRSSAWHYLQHVCFLGTALLFWYPVVRPYPSRPRWSGWLVLPYLLLADVQNTVLSALLTFSTKVLYPYYLEVPRLWRISALEDQSAAGVIMWVPGSLVFLVPLFWIGTRLLYGEKRAASGMKQARRDERITLRGARRLHALPHVPAHGRPRRLSLPLIPLSRLGESVGGDPATAHRRFDLLHVPLLGRFLRWRHARLAMQVPLLGAAAVLIFDGLYGPQVGPLNLAGVLPWIHWRGLLILGLLAVGNVFCMACPFLVPRTLARRWLPRGRSWPRWLRSKWLAVALLGIFLWAYEAFALWDSPWWTAWIAVGYFVAVFVIDGFFRGAAFCKYICPIGQFNFVQSLMSPLEVKVRDPEVCAACRTKDCIRGRDGIPGCELNLYQPRKAGNMDCTFCLDCVHACPHDNIGIVAEVPGKELWRDRLRSGIGRFGKRPDLAALVVVLVFGAFVNAAGMVAPVLEWQDQLASRLGLRSALAVTTLCYGLGLFVVPLVLVGAAATICRWWGELEASWLDVATRFCYVLIPLGIGMWLAHYSFHFLASFDAALPALQRFAGDVGLGTFYTPEWTHACCRPIARWLPRLEVFSLDMGLVLSLYLAYRTAPAPSKGVSQALRVLAPWALLLVLLFAAGVWIVLQPMQMRGAVFAQG